MSGSKHPPASRRTLEVEMDPEVKHSVEDEEYLSTVQRRDVESPTNINALDPTPENIEATKGTVLDPTPTNVEATKGTVLDPLNPLQVDPTLARALAEKKAITPNYWAHDSEYRVLTSLKDGPKHEREVCDRALAQVLENHGSITLEPHESGGMQLSITDKGRAKL